MAIDLAKAINPSVDRPHLKAIHGLMDPATGIQYAFVTDGHMMVAAVTESPPPECDQLPSERILPFMRAGERRFTVTAEDLSAWLEQVEGRMPFERDCDCGTGRMPCDCPTCGLPHDRNCERCDGTKRLCEESEPMEGTLDGSLFNRRLFARIFDAVGRPAAGSSIFVSIDPDHNKEKPALLAGPGWFAAVMPMRRQISALKVPALELVAA